jgi:hypothetical protein
MNKQCTCPECGRIAEVRRRANGQKLRYLYCVNNCWHVKSKERAAILETIERDPFGILGKFADSSPAISPDIEQNTQEIEPQNEPAPEQSEQGQIKHTPISENPAPVMQSEQQSETQNTPENSSMNSVFVGAIGVLAALIGAGIYIKTKKGA